MDGFKTWILSVCGAMILSSLFKMILSDSSLKKSVNIFFSLFILFYTVVPLSSAFGESQKNESEITAESNYGEIFDEAYKRIVEQSISNVCAEISVDISDIQIEAYSNDDGILYVESIKVDIVQNEKAQETENAINKQLGFEVDVC
ncbi:MAG: hypothetical protein ACI4SX_00575 [Candidatus Fimenecus sp.]